MSIDHIPTEESPRLSSEPYAARTESERAAQAAVLARVIADRELAMLEVLNNGNSKEEDLAAFMSQGGTLG